MELVRELVYFQYEILKRMLGGSLGVKKQPQLFFCDGGTAMKHLKRLGNPAKYPDHCPYDLASSELLAGVKDVGRLLGHGAGYAGHPPATLEGVGREVRVLEESGEEGTNQVHGGGARGL